MKAIPLMECVAKKFLKLPNIQKYKVSALTGYGCVATFVFVYNVSHFSVGIFEIIIIILSLIFLLIAVVIIFFAIKIILSMKRGKTLCRYL